MRAKDGPPPGSRNAAVAPAGDNAATTLSVSQVNWPRFRGPAGDGATAQAAPTVWGPDKNILWKAQLPGAGASSPIVWGDQIFLTAHTGYGVRPNDIGAMNDLQRSLMAVSTRDGKIVLSQSLKTRLPEQPYESRMHWHGYATNSCVADEKRVYAFIGKSGVFAFDHQGKQQWHADVGDQFHGWGSAASLVLHGDVVIVNACVESEALIALNRNTGKEVWRINGIKESWNTPLLVNAANGRTELVIADFDRIMGIDPATGKKLWWCKGINYYIVPSMVAHDGVVYCMGGRNYVSMAVRTGGEGDVTDSHILWRGDKGSNVSSMVYHDEYLYFVHDALGIATCLDAKTGKTIYAERLSARHAEFYASALLAGNHIYYLDRNGRTFVVAAKPKFEEIGFNDLDRGAGAFNAAPSVHNGRLLIRSDRYLYCIGAK